MWTAQRWGRQRAGKRSISKVITSFPSQSPLGSLLWGKEMLKLPQVSTGKVCSSLNTAISGLGQTPAAPTDSSRRAFPNKWAMCRARGGRDGTLAHPRTRCGDQRPKRAVVSCDEWAAEWLIFASLKQTPVNNSWPTFPRSKSQSSAVAVGPHSPSLDI